MQKYQAIDDPARRAYAAMITAMDDEIGRVIQALDERGLRKDTLVVFHSDNGGPRSAKFTGEVDTSKSTIPCDNGPYRDGKGTLYEGGTRVVSLFNWPGKIEPGVVVDEVIHVVDVHPTLAALAGTPAGKGKRLDGVDVWPVIAKGQRSPRDEVVYNLEPFAVGLRQGDWKLVWRPTLTSQVELFDLAKDPGETTNVADEHPEKVAELEKRAQELARERPAALPAGGSDVALRELLGSTGLPEDGREEPRAGAVAPSATARRARLGPRSANLRHSRPPRYATW
jgi:arylsulfatase A-like enzyme